jgi:hypothetical protein
MNKLFYVMSVDGGGYRGLFSAHILRLVEEAWGVMACPCDSGRKLQDCHGPKLDELRPLLPPEHFEKDLREMITEARAANIKLPDRDVMPRRMFRNREKRRRRKAQRR